MDEMFFVSEERLDIYSNILGLKDQEKMGGYLWNKALSSSIAPLLQCFEVTLRNAIDKAIRNKDRSSTGWDWASNERWIYELTKKAGDRIYKGKGRYVKDSNGNIAKKPDGSPRYAKMTNNEKSIFDIVKKLTRTNKKITTERIISNTTLGFWTELLSEKYEEPRLNSLLWPILLNDVFPNKPLSIKRGHIHKKVIFFKDIRNKISHNEAVWKFYNLDNNGKVDYSKPIYGKKASIRLLRKAYSEIVEVIGWMSNERKSSFESSGLGDRFKILATNNGLNSYIKKWDEIHSERVFIPIEIDTIKESIDCEKIERLLKNGKIFSLTKKGKEVYRIGWDLMKYNSGEN